MKILFLTFYFEPDLCAGSFRNSSLFNEVVDVLNPKDKIDVITTHPNRYISYKVSAKSLEKRENNITINRIKIPSHKSGLFGQIKSFIVFYLKAIKLAKKENYDLVYASSSRLFTAFLGARLARKNKAKLYLDIRDIFRESILDIFKNKLLKAGFNLFLKPIENYTFKTANHINLVSEGFKSYFQRFKQCTYSFYTNGIDDVFLNASKEISLKENKIKTIVYAGNIGEGQGLHLIIPETAKRFKDNFTFIIFGDGGAKEKLTTAIKEMQLTNVILKAPINRALLIEEYNKADYLFLHLNKHKAFERVLPSKLFEYGAFNKPIIAGVSGYASLFLKKHMTNSIVFKPGDFEELEKKISEFQYEKVVRTEFVEKFSRKLINKKMAKSIISM